MINIYLGGKISGLRPCVAKRQFASAQKRVEMACKKAGKTVCVINPCTQGFGDDWRVYMKSDIKKLVDCDVLVDIGNDDGTSKGLKLEKQIARALKIKILDEPDFAEWIKQENLHG